jgi:hypothetical protein
MLFWLCFNEIGPSLATGQRKNGGGESNFAGYSADLHFRFG